MDDLVERLRDTGLHSAAVAAARIEELEIGLRNAQGDVVAACSRITALEASLAEARRQALEEAAKVAEQWLEPIMATPHENATYRSIAKAIRALRDSPPPPTVV